MSADLIKNHRSTGLPCWLCLRGTLEDLYIESRREEAVDPYVFCVCCSRWFTGSGAERNLPRLRWHQFI